MSKKEQPPIPISAEGPEISAERAVPPDPRRKTKELLEMPPSRESEELRKVRIEEIREALQETPTKGGDVPQHIEATVSKPPTKMEWFRAVGYEIFIDPALKKIRGLISDLIPEDSTVIDIGCGSGALAFQLSKNKGCTVYGVDLAHNKIERAAQRKANADFPKVQFTKRDATDLAEISDQQFDCATMSLFLHSLPANVRRQVLQEAIRVAKKIVIADYVTTQPKSFPGLAVKSIERIAGGEHFQSFNQFRASGGLEPLLEAAGLVIVEEQLNPSKTVRVVAVERNKMK